MTDIAVQAARGSGTHHAARDSGPAVAISQVSLH